MTKSKSIRVLAAGLLFFGVTVATWAEGGHIAFVNVSRVLEEAPQAVAANRRLEKEFEVRNSQLLKLRKELRQLEDRLAQEGVTMSESQLKKLERDIRSLKREIRRAQEDYREDLNIRRNEELSRLQKRVYQTIVSLAKSEKYDMVLGDGVIYASPAVDITAKVLEMLQQEFKKSEAGGGKE
ncbi:MAG TPA: OmpH family outer membrane protein [Thiotrichales bacterium]|nr:OmpH family outer membrane protein [Thiotrichales bacterium]